MEVLVKNIANLFKVKSLITLAMTYGMVMLLSGRWIPHESIIALFSASYGSVITYFFKKDEPKQGEVYVKEFDA
jgi:hypothetical protein